jgi:two-component system CheB/CheR fusion protein
MGKIEHPSAQTEPEKPCKVLVVEDHHDSATLVSRVVWSAGFEVAVAENYQAALHAARADQFDVIVCDIGLPDGDGCDLLTEVKAMYGVRGVAMTGYGYEADRRRCELAGFEAFLLKPVSLEDLEATVRAVAAKTSCATQKRGHDQQQPN